MIRIKKYSIEYLNQWNTFIEESKQPLFLFKRDYMEYHSERFKDHSLLFFEGDELIAVLPLSEHENELRSHGGLTYGGCITNNKMKQNLMQECLLELICYMRDNSFDSILYKPVPHIYHRQPAEEDLYSLFRNKAVVEGIEASTVINLNAPIRMSKGRKAQISRARREGVQVIDSKEKCDFILFIDLENQVLKDKHNTSAVHTGEELNYLFSVFPENIKLYKAVYNNSLIAGAVVYIYQDVIHTQYMAANDIARKIGALDLVINNVIEQYKEEKTWLDFGISTEKNGIFLNEGLISQKEGFGGRTNIYMKLRVNI